MNRNAVLSACGAGRFSNAIMLALLALMLPLMVKSQDVVINEIMASNASIAPRTNNPNYQPDYIELYNRTANEIDLGAGNWAVSDKRNPESDNFKDFYRFPLGTTISANGYLLVFFDDRTTNGGIHTTYTVGGTNVTFTLRAGGDWVWLVKGLNPSLPGSANFTVVDSLEFGPQITDLAVGRVPDGETNSTAWTLTLPSPNGGGLPFSTNVPTAFLPPPTASTDLTLKINEWLAFNLTGSGKTNDDWFEIYNPDSNNIVSMGNMAFVDGGSVNDPEDLWKPENQLPRMSFIAPLGFVTLIADADDNDEDNNSKDPDVLDFSLSSTRAEGDFISMHASTNQGSALIDQVIWTAPLVTPRLSRGRVPDGSTNIVVLPNTTPGDRNFGGIPEIVISEVLAHTDPPFEDAIELQNVTSTNVNIGNWRLTNDPDVPDKFRIPTNTIVPPGGFFVFYEGRANSKFGVPKAAVGFNRSGTGDGRDFTLNSANGDEVYLFRSRPDGTVSGDRRGIDFGPSENGVSFGRYVTSSLNNTNVDYVAMSTRTFGQDNPATVQQFRLGTGKTNAAPKVGPVVITEVFYHPDAPYDELYEFIEIRNISDNVVPLYDPLVRSNFWRIKDAVSFTFPTNQSLAPDEYALIVNFDPQTNDVQLANFLTRFPTLPLGTKMYGPYGGELNDSDATVELAWPDRPQAVDRVDAGLVPYVVMDRLGYEDKAPWNPNADGGGGSLQRIVESDYGNDPINWKGRVPTPGQHNSLKEGIEPPRITSQPQSQTAKERFNTSFTVGARGGERSYQWLFNGENIADGTNATLQFIGVSTNDAGSYRVILSNTAGSVTSVVATLTVTPTPADLTRPSVTITSPTANARLSNSVVTLKGTASDNTALARIEYRIGANNFLTATGLTAWGAQVTLEPGTNVITARAVDTSGNALESKQLKVIYVVPSPLDLSVMGSGTVSGATNGQLLEVGRNYTLTATPVTGSVFSNWTGGVSGNSPKLTFRMEPNLEVIANFVPNPFAGTAGKYNGLFYDMDGVEHFQLGLLQLERDDTRHLLRVDHGGWQKAARLWNLQPRWPGHQCHCPHRHQQPDGPLVVAPGWFRSRQWHRLERKLVCGTGRRPRCLFDHQSLHQRRQVHLRHSRHAGRYRRA